MPQLLLILLLGFSGVACGSSHDAQDEKLSTLTDSCSTWTDSLNGNSIEYCVKISNRRKQQGKRLYAFHGMGSTPQALCRRWSTYVTPSQREGIDQVICPSFGPYWTIHENGRMESFFRFQAQIEKSHPLKSSHLPVLYGESMGGFNALKISGVAPSLSPRFQKVVAACPALFSIRLPSRSFANALPSSLFGSFDRETSISIIQESPYFDTGKVYPELLIIANQNDTVGKASFSIFGLSVIDLGGVYQGAVDFHQSLLKQGQINHLQAIPGSHCLGIPLDQVTDYLLKP